MDFEAVTLIEKSLARIIFSRNLFLQTESHLKTKFVKFIFENAMSKRKSAVLSPIKENLRSYLQ